MEAFEMNDVKEFDGENGKSAYVVFQDCAIDVTNSKLWKCRLHMRRHGAGADLTQDIQAAGTSS